MTALFEMPLVSETLTAEELQDITGAARKAEQVGWLEAHDWHYVRNRGGEPIVGRLYARLKLAGLSPQTLLTPPNDTWEPDMSYLHTRGRGRAA